MSNDDLRIQGGGDKGDKMDQATGRTETKGEREGISIDRL